MKTGKEDREDAVVVLSGGQDSTYCAAWAKLNFKHVRCVTFDYGQRHRREIDAARTVAKLLELPHEVVSLGAGILHGSSPLVSSAPLEQYGTPEQMAEVIGDRVELTFVPLRNALFLILAANRAACVSDDCVVVTGVCQDDNANYPDCREQFIDEMEFTIDTALGRRIGHTIIETPLMHLSKGDQVLEMHSMGASPLYAFTHTSYAGDYPPLDRNHATVLREQAFALAKLPDPLIVRAAMEGLMPLPFADNYKDQRALVALERAITMFKEHLDFLSLPVAEVAGVAHR